MELPFNTLSEAFLDRTTGALRDKVYLRYKPTHGGPYCDMTFAEFAKRTRELFAGFSRLGLTRGDRIAIVSESRPEWLMAEFAALALGAIVVPMFPTLTAQQIEFIVHNSGAKLLLVSNDLQISKATKVAPECPAVQAVISMNDETKISIPPNIRFYPMSSLSNIDGHTPDFDFEIRKAMRSDTISLIYTSGTTGNPKGVVLTHGNILSNIEGAIDAIPPIDENDTALSFLPLCHAFEHVAMHLFFIKGFTVGFAESVETVADNLLEIRPTIMTGVPRFYERVYERIMRRREKLEGIQRKIFDWGLHIGGLNGRSFEGMSVPIHAKMLKPLADSLVLKKIRERTGGRIRFFVSGAAALPAEVGRAFAAFGLPILEGYGMTEASPVISVSPISKIKWGSVGIPLNNIEVKIADDDEILVRGQSVMQRYYKLPDETRETIDSDGWLHTGDVGDIDSDGFIKITDRKKHLLVSSGGKNIAPSPIESLIGESPYIDQVMLLGDKRPFCAALIVPDFAALREANIIVGDDENISENDNLRALIGKELDRIQTGLVNYERARRFAIISEPFSIENGMMTPTLKVKRKAAEERYKELIDFMYRLRPVEDDNRKTSTS